MEQVIDGFRFEPQDTLLYRRDRADVITVGADIPRGVTAAQVQAEVQETIEAMEIPEGYAMEWGGELESAGGAGRLGQAIALQHHHHGSDLGPAVQRAETADHRLLVPMAVNGVSLALLGTGLPFTLPRFWGLSLSGMLIKNGIVLVEEIDLTQPPIDAI